MKEINNDFLTGFIHSFYWLDNYNSVYIFETDKTGMKEDAKGNIFYFDWKINESGVIAFIYKDNEDVIYWKINLDDNKLFEIEEFNKIQNEENEEKSKDIENKDFISFNVEEFLKKVDKNKPVKINNFKLQRFSMKNIEEDYKSNNIEKIKEILKDYNKYNYFILIVSFILFEIIVTTILNNIVIIKDFTIFFQIILCFVITIFTFRPLWFFSNKLSYKFRTHIELKNKTKKDH